MSTKQNTTPTGDYESKISGYATTTDSQVLHITAMVRGECCRYILPRKEFDQFATGHTVMGYSRETLNVGEFEAAKSIRFEWIAGQPVMVDLLNDPLEEHKLWFDAAGFADVWTLNRRVCWLHGSETLYGPLDIIETELQRIVKVEALGGYGVDV